MTGCKKKILIDFLNKANCINWDIDDILSTFCFYNLQVSHVEIITAIKEWQAQKY